MATKGGKRAKGTAGKGSRVQVEVQVLDVRRDDDVPPLSAYAFSSSGRLLDRVEIESGKAAELTLPAAKEPTDVRVLVGPSLEVDGPRLLSDLVRIDAAETMFRPGLADKLKFPIDRLRWHCWLRFCTVRGTLVKRVTLGGAHSELPVCGAEVEIYEVDPVPIIVSKIPDYILDRLREYVVRPLPLPDPPPFMPPEPAPVPVERFEPAAGIEESRDIELAGEAASSDAEPEQFRLFRFRGEEQRSVSREEVSDALRAVRDEPALVRAASISKSAFREALIANPVIVRPLLCFIWPAAVTTQLVATATSDECGHFRAIFYRGCSSDVPDLYFKAYRRIGFWRLPIYTPTPIACYTWWNYVCGTEVKLVTTSPFARVCPPCPPVIAPAHWVLAMAVGNTSLARLHGVGSGLPITPGNLGLRDDGAPWGGYLRFRFEFDHDLRTDLNVRYYRVQWRKKGSGNPYVDMTDAQLRHYMEEDGSGTFPIKPYSLGPQTVGSSSNLFEIPPAAPPGWPNSQWVTADAVVDTCSAGFASPEFAPPAEAGLYDIRLQLFDAAGGKVNANTLGITYRVPATTDLTATIPTEDASSLGLVAADGSLRFTLRIDNNPCSGSIGPASLGSQSVESDECGVLEYASTAATMDLPFTASHPNGFATYEFRVVKGLTKVLEDSGPVGPPPGERNLTPTVASLLGGCVTAGFAEDLYVRATATNGWSRQNQYDARPLPRPFVLTSS